MAHSYYNGWKLQREDIAYTSGGTTETVRYVWGKDLSGTLQGAGGIVGLLATQVGGAWYFPADDANGNVTQYVDADGHVVASYTYDAFGNTVAQSGAMAGTFPFRFSTKYYDSESGLYYYGYRFYSPKLGHWLTRDPIEEAGGVNLYGFCGNTGFHRCDLLGCESLETFILNQYASRIEKYLKQGDEDRAAAEALKMYKQMAVWGGFENKTAAKLLKYWLVPPTYDSEGGVSEKREYTIQEEIV